MLLILSALIVVALAESVSHRRLPTYGEHHAR